MEEVDCLRRAGQGDGRKRTNRREGRKGEQRKGDTNTMKEIGNGQEIKIGKREVGKIRNGRIWKDRRVRRKEDNAMRICEKKNKKRRIS